MAQRELKITYGSYVCGYGQAKRHVDGPHRLTDGPDAFSFSFDLVIAGTDDADDFATEVAAARTAFRLNEQRLLVELVNSSTGVVEATLLDAKPTSTGRTAFQIVPEMGKPGAEDVDSARSCLLGVTIRGQRIADYDADSLRLDFSYTVTKTAANRRRLDVRGSYTATADAASRATYEAEFLTKCQALQTALGGDWPDVPALGNTSTTTKEDGLTTFSAGFWEIKHSESGSAVDDPDVTNQQLVITAALEPGDGDQSERRLSRIEASYRADVDFDQREGVTDLRSLWDAKVLPWIKQNIGDATSNSVRAYLEATPSYDPDNNVLSARVVALASTGTTIARLVTTEDYVDFGNILRPTWPDKVSDDLTPTPAYRYRGPKTIIRTVTTVTRTLGTVLPTQLGGGASGGGGAGAIGAGIGAQLKLDFPPAGIFSLGAGANTRLEFGGAGGGGAGGGGRQGGQSIPGANIGSGGVPLTRRTTNTPRWLGLPGSQIAVTDQTVIEVFQVIGTPPAGSAAGGTGESQVKSRQGSR